MQVVSQNSHLLAPIAVDAVMKVIDPATATNVDLRDIKIVKKIGGTVDDTELIEGPSAPLLSSPQRPLCPNLRIPIAASHFIRTVLYQVFEK